MFHRLATVLAAILLLAAGASLCLADPTGGAVATYGQMKRALVADCIRSPRALHLYAIGTASSGMRTLWMVRVSAEPSDADLGKTRRILVICRQHGDEPVSTQAALLMLARYATERRVELHRRIGDITVYIIPMANPDGASAMQRLSGDGADLNRDWGKFTQPETRAIFRAYKLIRPQAVLDLHSWDLTDPFQGNSIEAGISDDTPPQAMSLSLRGAMIAAERRQGVAVCPMSFSAAADRTLAHRFFASQGAVSLLIETSSCRPTARQIAARVGIDESAIDQLLGSLQSRPSEWERVARFQGSTVAPNSAFVYSADQLSVRPNESAARRPVRAQPMNANATISTTRARKALWWAIGLYALGCLVLARFLGRTALRAIARLLGTGRGRVNTTAPTYISARRRMFPADVPIAYSRRSAHTGIMPPSRRASPLEGQDPWELLRAATRQRSR